MRRPDPEDERDCFVCGRVALWRQWVRMIRRDVCVWHVVYPYKPHPFDEAA